MSQVEQWSHSGGGSTDLVAGNTAGFPHRVRNFGPDGITVSNGGANGRAIPPGSSIDVCNFSAISVGPSAAGSQTARGTFERLSST